MLRALPIIILLAGAGYAAHWFIVGQLNNRIVNLENDLEQTRVERIAFEAAAQNAEQTISSLQQKMTEQTARITEMSATNQQLAAERDEYLSIFRRHDLYKLAKAKPGLVEPRINNGTKQVFDQVEEDSRETANADNEASNQ